MDLSLVYLFHAIIAAILTYGVVSLNVFRVRKVLFIFLLVIIASAVNFMQIEHDYKVSKLNDRIDAANSQIISLAKCQGTGTICDWETK